MKICIVSPYANPEKGAAIVRVNSFSDYFTSKGNEVMVFSPARGGLESRENTVRYNGILGLLGLLWKTDFDVLIGVSPPITHPFFAMLVCKVKRKRFVLDSKDVFTQTAAKLETAGKKRMKFRVYALMEMLAHRNSDKILVLDSTIGGWLEKRYSLPREKIVVAPNGVDTKLVFLDLAEGKKIRKKFGIGAGSMVLIYLGGLGDECYMDFLRECAGVIKKASAVVLFVIASDETPLAMDRIAGIESAVKQLGLEGNFRLVKNVPHNEVYRYLSAADIGVDFWEGFELFAVPVKILEYMACGLPVVIKTPKNNESFRKFFSENDAGFQSDNWQELAENLRGILENFAPFRFKARNNAGIIKTAYTRDACNAEVLRVLKDFR